VFLSRVELSPRAAEREAFWREVARPYGAHQALWNLFARDSVQKRDFLFRAEESPGRTSFLVLSSDRPEMPADGLWRIESRPFAPALRAGQRLGFRMRASPVVRQGQRVDGKTNRRVHRHDVVMHLTKSLVAEGKPLPGLTERVRDAGLRWLRQQATRAGFRLVEEEVEAIGQDGLLDAGGPTRAALRVEGYRQHRIVRRGATAIRFSTLDFEGLIEVTDPAVFLTKVQAGFGPQKAFGCGLMLLRRA
jgi:CRISPR system Cascade subunit CasE